MLNWLKPKKEKQSTPEHTRETRPAKKALQEETKEVSAQPTETKKGVSAAAEEQLEKLHAKIDATAERFSRGEINPVQFQELYSHYQSNIQEIEQFLSMNPDSEEWKNLVADGQSMILRKRYAARLSGFAIYDHRNGMPLKTIGNFGIDPGLFVPMLYAYQSATKEIFGGAVRSTQIEGGKWLCFVSGKVTTTLALFTTEPSQQQMKSLEKIHSVFENANAERLMASPVDETTLVCPHEYYLSHPL
jgi:hypothetical protein